jgi:hypothetical protein
MRQALGLRIRAVISVLGIVGVISTLALSAYGLREGTPIVIAGAMIPWLNVYPSDVVAFAYRDGWIQITVQIDERDLREYSQIYGSPVDDVTSRGGFGRNVFGEVYCDPTTFTGADSDPSLDSNDEIVLMTDDAGIQTLAIDDPAGTRKGSGLEIELLDPLTDQSSYLYLFLNDGSLDPSAGVSYVDYDFQLLSGEYMATYNTVGIDETTGLRNSDHGEQLNPEDSLIRTRVYERHWSYRWTCDSLSLFGGPNLVEREDYWIAPGSCGRHIGTFNAQEGAFIANISGPVRAIRSYLGANSGPLVQVDRIYYEAREDVTVYVRVHPRASVGMFYVDHTDAAIGMTYANDLNIQGVVIDGIPDRLVLGPISWEFVTGELGSTIRIHDMDTDIDFASEDLTLFYADEANTTINLCETCLSGCRQPEPMGDGDLIGASGVWNTASLPNTDPALLATQYLTTLVTFYYGDSAWSVGDAAIRREWADVPMDIQLAPWPAPSG